MQQNSIYYGFGDNQKLPFPDASFDRYISNSTLTFVDDPQAQINEAYRVLEEGGRLGMSVFSGMDKIKYVRILL